MVRMILRCMTGIALASSAMYGAYTIAKTTELLSINPTTSLTPGIYVRTFGVPDRGDIVKFRMPHVMIDWLEDNGHEEAADYFLQKGNGLLKVVVAKHGDVVCVINEDINVNGSKVGTVYHGMLEWDECRSMEHDELFVLTPTVDGIDSRMYGPIKANSAKTYALLIRTRANDHIGKEHKEAADNHPAH